MNRTLRSSVVTLASALAVVIGGWAASLSGREQAGGGAAPADSVDLLRAAPFDRITLIDGSAPFFVDPVSPRPLPPFDPKDDKQALRATGAR